MKKTIKIYILGFITACLMMTPLSAFADTIQVALNTVNINLNGAQVVTKGESYVHANGTILPYSLNYKGTVYLPIRKVSEIMGKDIGFDAKTSTVGISDKYLVPATSTPTPTPTSSAVVPNNNTSGNTGKVEDDSHNSRTETGYVVINSFGKTKNDDDKWVNRAKGFMDGDSFSMLTSKTGLIEFTAAAPFVYEITYRDDIISDIDMLSTDKEDMLKASAEAGKLQGYKDAYDLSSKVVVYRMERDGNGAFKEYSVSGVSSLMAGDKVYLYDIDGKSGYDIVIEEDSWI